MARSDRCQVGEPVDRLALLKLDRSTGGAHP